MVCDDTNHALIIMLIKSDLQWTHKIHTFSNECENCLLLSDSTHWWMNGMNKNEKAVLTGGVAGIALWKTVQCTYQIAIPMQTSQTNRGRGDRYHYKRSSQTTGTHTCLPGDNRGINLTWVYLVYFICQTTDIWKRILFFKLLQFTQLMYFNK